MKHFYIRLFQMAVILLFTGSTAWADEATIDNVVYTVNTEQNTAIVKGPAAETALGALVIPATIEVQNICYDVTTIGMDAFKGNTTLTSVSIPASVTKIESHAFEGCSNLASITFHEGQDLQFSRRSFRNCTALTELNLPACYSDQFVTEGEYEGKNGEAVFAGCTGLTKVTFASGSKLQHTYNYMFQNTTALQDINLEECTELTNIAGWMFQGSGLTKVTLPASITVLEQKCFQNCKKLASVDMTSCSDLTTIGEFSFAFNIFPSIDLSGSTQLKSFGQYCFANNEHLETIVLPSSLTSLGDYCFQNDKKLSSVNIEACTGLTTIPNRAFQNCKALTSLDFTKCTELTLIHTNSFQNCDLHMVDLSECSKIDTLREWAFAGNKNLKTIILPKSLRIIYGDAFNGDTSLENVVYLNEAFDWTQTSTVVLNKPAAFNKVARTVKAYYYKDNINVPENMNNSDGTIVEMIPVAPITIASGSEWDTYFTANTAITIPEEIECCIVTTAENGVVITSKVSGILPKATPVIVKSTAGTYYPKVLPENMDEAPMNMLGGLENAAETTGGDKYYRFGFDSEQIPGFFLADADGTAFTGDANKAYLALSSSTAGTKKVFYLNSIPTGISNICNTPSAPTTIYDLQGRRVTNTKAHGIYIINGKKMLSNDDE